MRIPHLVVVGAFAISAVLGAPALARNADAHKGEDKPASSSCSAYQQAADGSWEQLPCKEMGERAQPQHRAPAQGTDHEER